MAQRYSEVEDPKSFVDAHIRFPVELHEQLVQIAEENYLSLNKLVVQTMALRARTKGDLDR